jgi:hypothetical protein
VEQTELIAGLPPTKPRKRRAGSLDTTQRNCYKPAESGVGAVNLPRPSWATAGRPMEPDRGEKREKGQPLSSLDRVRGKRVQLLRSRITANALLRLPVSLVDKGKYEKTLSCGTTITRARFDGRADSRSLNFGRCCRYRWCEFCSAARLGEWRKKFQPELAKWSSLTAPAVATIG